jgi:CheY-like chemotaxis protein
MGGAAGASSTLGVGSTFWFTARLRKHRAPAVSEALAAVDVEGRVRRQFAGCRVLVVDDEPINREVAAMYLESVGLLVDAARDGAEAVTLAQKTAYAAILMDMQMPHLNGLEATRRIRALPVYRDVPIIAMTANAFAEDKALCFEAGMDEFLAKPFDSDLFFSILLRALGRATT